MHTLNEAYSTLAVRRRYEVWFVRLALADGRGALWFRYLLMNPGRGGCVGSPQGMPVQIWASWFPAAGKPQTFIQGLQDSGLNFSKKGQSPFLFRIDENEIGEDYCRGDLNVGGHRIAWNLRYRSTFHVTLSSKGWIGFSRTPHSDAIFSGEISFDGTSFAGNPLGFGVQGHNCGYRHRNFWRWTHCYFSRSDGGASTLEALVYEMPFGLVFRKAVLWHNAKAYVFSKMLETRKRREEMQWDFVCDADHGLKLEAAINGSGQSRHSLAYKKTNCAGDFEVSNNSLASASLLLKQPGGTIERLETSGGAVLEMVG